MKGYLVLENGKVFTGTRFGSEKDVVGELVFTTGVVGYIETVTDAVCSGQLLLGTFPISGNYGMIEEDMLGDCLLGGFIVRELCNTPSNFRSEYELNRFFREKDVPVLCGIDTRELTRILRTEGTMNAAILSEVPNDLSFIASFTCDNGAREYYQAEVKKYPSVNKKCCNVTLIDCGAPGNVIDALTARGCEVTRVPFDTEVDNVLLSNPDGVVITDGSGSPSGLPETLKTVSALLGKVPVFGMGIGGSIVASALGAQQVKLKHGHRGGNYPVKDLAGVRTYITSQNHAYTCDVRQISDCNITFVNLNDKTCEGFINENKKAMSVFFRPDVSGGPQDTSFIYDSFISLMGGKE